MRKRPPAFTGTVHDFRLPNIGIVQSPKGAVKVKGTLPGQLVLAQPKSKKTGARLLEIVERAPYEIPAACVHSELCGGCCFQSVPYQNQLAIKESAVKALFAADALSMGTYHGILASPQTTGYRNKMEFSFGDMEKGGALSLGLRKKNSFYEVVFVEHCQIIDEDYRVVLRETLRFFRAAGLPYYNNRRAEGILRHLVVRKSHAFGDMLVNLVTTSQISPEAVAGFKDALLALHPQIKLTGILHTVHDGLADVVCLADTRLLYGSDSFLEEVCGLKFKITPGSFFQTNTGGAALLYEKTLSFINNCDVAFDLYSGTGTITQLLAKKAKRAIGIEIVPEAVESARENARLNHIENAEFICGDVLQKIDELNLSPDLIVLDPPRDGIHPKAIDKIIAFGAPQVIYISCKPTSLVRDLAAWASSGYRVQESFMVDMFPWCGHVETLVLLSKPKNNQGTSR